MFMRSLLAGTTLAVMALPAVADVNIYSSRQPELLQPLVDAFTAKTGIKVNVAFINSGMAERLMAEGSRSPADLVMTVDIARLSEIKAAGVLQPVQSAVLESGIPAEFRDPDGLWFGLTSRARIVYASRDRVPDGEITTYEDLANPKWNGRICTRVGTHDYNLALTSAYISHHGRDAAKTWLTAVKANLARKPTGNDRDQVKAIWAGECDISLGNTYYMGQMLADPVQTDWANSVRIVFPTFESGGTHMNISGVAMTKAAPNKAEALQLMEFLATDEAQAIYAQTNHEFPVKPGVRRSDLVQGWGDYTPDTVNLGEVAANRPAALKLMEEVNFDG